MSSLSESQQPPTSPSPPAPARRPRLTQEEALELKAEAEFQWRSRHPYQPQLPSPPQWRFLQLQCREALYGGAAGGGKSSALLLAALEYVHVRGYAALLLRRSFADLAMPEALMARAHEWLDGTDARWNERDKTWHFPSGATLTFGYLEHDKDKGRYMGAAFQFIGFDELTQFPESLYRFLMSRLRKRKDMDVPLRMRAASNPGGEGHEWVKQRFLVEGPKAGRVFIPARLEDNPHLDQDDYRKSLAELDAMTRAQLERGDWDASPEGLLIHKSMFQVLPGIPGGPAAWRWVRFWDLAATAPGKGKKPDWTAGVLVGHRKGDFLVADVRHAQANVADVDELVVDTAKYDREWFGDVAIRMEQEPGASGKRTVHYFQELLAGFNFRGYPSTGNKVLRFRPVVAAIQNRRFYVLQGDWNTEYIDELVAMPTPGVPDDQADGTSGAVNEHAHPERWLI